METYQPNPTAQPQPNELQTTPVVEQNQAAPSAVRSSLLPILGGILLLMLVAGGAYYLGIHTKPSTVQVIQNDPPPTVTPETAAVEPTTPPTLDIRNQTVSSEAWNTYASRTHRFAIEYPKTNPYDPRGPRYQGEWALSETRSDDSKLWSVHFGPLSIPEDTLMAVNVDNTMYKNVDQIIAEQGNQFADRKESRKDIVLDGVPATLVKVTSNQYGPWESEFVVVQKGTWIYVIHAPQPEFEHFYKSFRFLN